VLAQHEDHAEDMRWRAKRALKDVAELLEKMSASWACAGQALSALSQLERDREKAGTPTEAVGTASHNIGEWPGYVHPIWDDPVRAELLSFEWLLGATEEQSWWRV
jgi:hypothetical protein